MWLKQINTQLDKRLMNFHLLLRESTFNAMCRLGLVEEPVKALKPVRITRQHAGGRNQATWR
jgi:hypothetical protein